MSAIPSHVRHAPESELTAAYLELKARLGWRVARVAAARKLVRIIYHMLSTNEPWCATPTWTQTARDELQQSAVAQTTSSYSD